MLVYKCKHCDSKLEVPRQFHKRIAFLKAQMIGRFCPNRDDYCRFRLDTIETIKKAIND